MQNQPVFKKAAFGGFDKRSVLDYILELNTTTQEAQEKLNSQLEEVTASREKLNETLREMEQKLQTSQKDYNNLASELSSEKARSRELNHLIDSLGEEIKKQEQIIAEKDEEIAQHLSRCNELEEKNQVLEEKKEEVERASAYIGELLLRTRTDSERILSDASRQAEKMVLEAGQSLEDVHAQFAQFSGEMAGLQKQIQESMLSVQAKFSNITSTVEQAEQSLREICFPPQNELKLIGEEEQEPSPPNEKRPDFFRSAAQP